MEIFGPKSNQRRIFKIEFRSCVWHNNERVRIKNRLSDLFFLLFLIFLRESKSNQHSNVK